MSKTLYYLVGGGGTGSYLVPMLLKKIKEEGNNDLLAVVDGDIVENNNLTRQFFYEDDLGKNKARALVSHQKIEGSNAMFIEDYMRSVTHLVKTVKLLLSFNSDVERLVLICGADNNMVRYRLELAIHYLLEVESLDNVTYVDSGNTEILGQVLYSSYNTGDSEVLEDGTITIKGGVSNSIFAHIEREVFEDKLTLGDFEMSCDELGESAPQNIATNQLAAYCIYNAIEYETGYDFNSSTNHVIKREPISIERMNENIKDLVNTTIHEEETEEKEYEYKVNWG